MERQLQLSWSPILTQENLTMRVSVRSFVAGDKGAVDQVVRDAWIELASAMPQWDELAPRLGGLTAAADQCEILVAELAGAIVGAVGYVGPHQPKPGFFAPEWPMVRFMSVVPTARGQGVGSALLNACIGRAERDQSPLIALHTTPVMKAAQHLYRRSGFEVLRALPDMQGVPYVLMTRKIQAT